MTTDIAAVAAVAMAYLEALHAGDADRLAILFIPESALFARGSDGRAAILPRDHWLERVRSRQSTRDAAHPDAGEVFAVEVVGTMGMARTTTSHPPNRFDDLLSLVKTDDGWKIAAKIYHMSPI